MNEFSPINKKTLFLNIIWHQHQPLYLDPETDQLQGPWVRSHGTKDYYDMAAIVEKYPNVHFTVNLTSSLLFQLQKYYVDRLLPFINFKKNRIDANAYFTKYGGKTDPWIDLALKPTNKFNNRDLEFLLTNVWNAFGVNEVVIDRFPEYKKLREKFRQEGKSKLTEQDLREIKFWFYLAHFDPDFLDNTYKLCTGKIVDLSDLIQKKAGGIYLLKKQIDEDQCNRIIVETIKILSAVVPLHKKLMYKHSANKGQIEIITTPYYHPILPLLYDSDLAKLCQPNDPMPPRFHYSKDAEAQIAKAVFEYKKTFGAKPTGMWPAEGSVAHDIISVFAKQGISWIATDQKILERSKAAQKACFYPYAAYPVSNSNEKEAAVIVFRETELSDKIGFVYKDYEGEHAADDFINSILKYVPNQDEPDRLLTVILDGENAWEWYKYDNDGKNFQNVLYRKLSKLYETRQVVTSTVTEYIYGNPYRGIPAHPIELLPKIDWLWPGSWINANYDTWIGEEEENTAWEYLLIARQDLENSKLPQPNPSKLPPKEKSKAWYIYRAWESLYAAEGSDWFWWYGTDQNAPSGDKPFDVAFITHLKNIYKYAKLAGGKMPKRDFKPISRTTVIDEERISQGTMAQSQPDLVQVLFQCDARGIYVRKSLYIAGNVEKLGNWTPNKIRLYNDGSHGDPIADDSIWAVEIYLQEGAEIEYKYTNSGAEGSWDPGEEFPYINRKIKVQRSESGKMVLLDRFGQI